MTRPYEPELRSIPLTFLDCPDITPIFKRRSAMSWGANAFYRTNSLLDQSECNIALLAKECGTRCAWLRENGKCPRGFP